MEGSQGFERCSFVDFFFGWSMVVCREMSSGVEKLGVSRLEG